MPPETTAYIEIGQRVLINEQVKKCWWWHDRGGYAWLQNPEGVYVIRKARNGMFFTVADSMEDGNKHTCSGISFYCLELYDEPVYSPSKIVFEFKLRQLLGRWF